MVAYLEVAKHHIEKCYSSLFKVRASRLSSDYGGLYQCSKAEAKICDRRMKAAKEPVCAYLRRLTPAGVIHQRRRRRRQRRLRRRRFIVGSGLAEASTPARCWAGAVAEEERGQQSHLARGGDRGIARRRGEGGGLDPDGGVAGRMREPSQIAGRMREPSQNDLPPLPTLPHIRRFFATGPRPAASGQSLVRKARGSACSLLGGGRCRRGERPTIAPSSRRRSGNRGTKWGGEGGGLDPFGGVGWTKGENGKVGPLRRGRQQKHQQSAQQSVQHSAQQSAKKSAQQNAQQSAQQSAQESAKESAPT